MGNIKLFAMFCVLPFLSRTAHPATNLTNVISAVSVLMSTRLIQYQFSHPHSRASTAAVSCTASLLFVLNMRRVVPRTHARTHTHTHTYSHLSSLLCASLLLWYKYKFSTVRPYERSSDVCTSVERIVSGCSHGNLRERGCAEPPHSPPRSATNRAVPSLRYSTTLLRAAHQLWQSLTIKTEE